MNVAKGRDIGRKRGMGRVKEFQLSLGKFNFLTCTKRKCVCHVAEAQGSVKEILQIGTRNSQWKVL